MAAHSYRSREGNGGLHVGGRPARPDSDTRDVVDITEDSLGPARRDGR